MINENDWWRWFSGKMAYFRSIADDIAVILVINVRGETPVVKDYEYYSIQSSFLCDYEIDDLLNAMRENGLYVLHFYTEKDFISWCISGGYHKLNKKFKIVYSSASNNIGPGKRSFIPAFCDHYDIPTVNSDPFSCALGRHKHHVNRLLHIYDIPVPKSWLFLPDGQWLNNDKPYHGAKIIAKATYEGSSLGVILDGIGNYNVNMDLTFSKLSKQLNQPLTVQEFVSGYEFEIPIIECLHQQHSTSPVSVTIDGCSLLCDRVLDYDQIYDENYCYSVDKIENIDMDELLMNAKKASNILGFKGYNRIDMRASLEGKAVIIDVSSTPHLIVNSSFTAGFKNRALSYSDMLMGLITVGLINSGLFYSSVQNCKSENSNPLPQKSQHGPIWGE